MSNDKLRKAAQKVWDTIPATYDEDHPTVKAHAAALKELGAALADSADAPPEPTEEMTNLDLARTAVNALGELVHRGNGILEQARCDVLNFHLDVQVLLVKRDALAAAQKEG